MGLSESKSYQQYIRCRAKDDTEGALRHLHECLDEVNRRGQEVDERAFVLQLIANLLLSQGRRSEAFEYQTKALSAGPPSLLTRFHYAKFLSKAGEFARAISECDGIIRTATEMPFPETDGDFSSDHYLRVARELKAECLEQRSSLGG